VSHQPRQPAVLSTAVVSTAVLSTALLSLLTAPAFAARTAELAPRLEAGASAPKQEDDKKAEYEKRLAAAEGDAAKLWKVFEWCETRGMEKEGRSVLRKILKLNENDRKAHELLGEVEYDGKWFATEKKVEEYKKKQLEEEAKRTGKAIYKGELVDPADLPMLERGMVKTEGGDWVSAEDFKKMSEGWVKQDLTWVSPEELPNIEKGLWKCGDKWLAEAEADAYHAELGMWWKVPSDNFVIYSTCSRQTVEKIKEECKRAFREFNRVLGKSPATRVPILVLNSAEQYNSFAAGTGRDPIELRGFSSLHGATIAEVWAEPLREGMSSAGMTYWNVAVEADNIRGPIFVRHAAAQALAEGLDPSPKTLAAIASQRAGQAVDDDWWKEKHFPTWFRYGAVSYVERYIADQFVGANGDPDWIRKWSKENLIRVGGLDPIDTILACSLSLEQFDASTKLLNETGLLMHFILDGKHPPVAEAHGALKAAFKAGKDPKALKLAFTNLETALKKSEAEFRKFAGM
jgi:hypothetical protein